MQETNKIENKKRKFTIDHIRKLSLAKLGKKRNPHTEETKRKISNSNKGQIPWIKGVGHSEATKIKLSEMFRGKNGPNWKNGKTALCEIIRNNYKYIQWRFNVFTRDNFTCQDCGDKTGNNLQGDHIIPLSFIIDDCKITNTEDALNCEVLWDISNGRTLCVKCHRKTKTYARGATKFKKG